MADPALDLLLGLGRRRRRQTLGERADDVQRRDAEAVLDEAGPRRSWVGRSRAHAGVNRKTEAEKRIIKQ